MKIYAIDIATNPALRSLWCPDTTLPPSKTHLAKLPAGGYASPMGFWIYTTPTPSITDAFEITINESKYAFDEANKTGSSQQLMQTTWIDAYKTKDELMLTVGMCSAHVITKDSTWTMIQQPVLLCVMQYWRFEIINRQLNHLSGLVSHDLKYATMPTLCSWFNARRFMTNDFIARKLSHDMPYFQSPLLAPYRALRNDYLVEMYWELIERLDMEGWAEQIDYQHETINAVYEAVTEKFYHYKSFTLEIIFEVLIIAILIMNFIFFVH